MERESKNNDKGDISQGVVNAVYVYQNMKDWLIKSKLLSQLTQVEGIDTKSFGGGKVLWKICGLICRKTGLVTRQKKTILL